MNPGKVIGRVVATSKYENLEGKKILLLEPLTWEEVEEVFNGKSTLKRKPNNKSIIALDAVGSGAGEYVFYVSSKEAAQAFDDDPICDNAVIGIIDGIQMVESAVASATSVKLKVKKKNEK